MPAGLSAVPRRPRPASLLSPTVDSPRSACRPPPFEGSHPDAQSRNPGGPRTVWTARSQDRRAGDGCPLPHRRAPSSRDAGEPSGRGPDPVAAETRERRRDGGGGRYRRHRGKRLDARKAGSALQAAPSRLPSSPSSRALRFVARARACSWDEGSTPRASPPLPCRERPPADRPSRRAARCPGPRPSGMATPVHRPSSQERQGSNGTRLRALPTPRPVLAASGAGSRQGSGLLGARAAKPLAAASARTTEAHRAAGPSDGGLVQRGRRAASRGSARPARPRRSWGMRLGLRTGALPTPRRPSAAEAARRSAPRGSCPRDAGGSRSCPHQVQILLTSPRAHPQHGLFGPPVRGGETVDILEEAGRPSHELRPHERGEVERLRPRMAA